MVDGRVIASHLGEYKLPSQADVPLLRTELVGSTDGPGPFAAKAIGVEIPKAVMFRADRVIQ